MKSVHQLERRTTPCQLTLPADQPADFAEPGLHDWQIIFLPIDELLALAPNNPLGRGGLELAVPRDELPLRREDEVGTPCSGTFERSFNDTNGEVLRSTASPSVNVRDVQSQWSGRAVQAAGSRKKGRLLPAQGPIIPHLAPPAAGHGCSTGPSAA